MFPNVLRNTEPREGRERGKDGGKNQSGAEAAVDWGCTARLTSQEICKASAQPRCHL